LPGLRAGQEKGPAPIKGKGPGNEVAFDGEMEGWFDGWVIDY